MRNPQPPPGRDPAYRASGDAHAGPSFSLGNRLGRLCWGLVQATLFRWSPRPFHGWRRFLLRTFGAKIAGSCHIYPGAIIWAPWNLECAEDVGVASGAILYSQAKIRLGRRAVVSQGAHLCSGSHDYEDGGFPLFAKPINVGAYAWLAAECFVQPGITIGDGAVIGARSVVTKDVPAWTVCAGQPCKPIKPRLWRPDSDHSGKDA